jgi:aryl-alcohol dehydrogenase-like predicted oxidoreductase
MRYRRMGHSDLSLSEVGFGCGGNAGTMIRGSFEEQRRIVARALELGINYFDTAPDYGAGVAEENLGRVLKALKARPVITSKVEVRQEDRGAIADHVVRSAEASLKRLGIDCLDILQIHNGPTLEPVPMAGKYYAQLPLDDFVRPGGAIEGLQRILQDGKARYVGFICRGNDGTAVRRLLDTGGFHMINVAYNLLNPTAGAARPPGLAIERDFDRALDAARDSGVGTAIYSALAGGFLTDDSVRGENRHPLARAVDPAAEKARRGREQAAKLLFLARDSGISLAQAAYRFVLAHPGVTTVLGGFSAMQQLEELAAVSGAGPFAADLLARLEQVWSSNFADDARRQR